MADNTTIKHGFDGNPPEFGIKRGTEVKDTHGRITREAEESIINNNVDRVEWMFAHGRISQAQYHAARQLQGDAELAALSNYASIDGGRSSSGVNRLPDVKCDAISRKNAARAAVFAQHGCAGWRIIELIILENTPTESAYRRMNLPSRGAGPWLLNGSLDALAKHYGMM